MPNSIPLITLLLKRGASHDYVRRTLLNVIDSGDVIAAQVLFTAEVKPTAEALDLAIKNKHDAIVKALKAGSY